MKKLLFVISQLYKGGAENSLLNLLSSLSPKDFEIDLIVLNQYPVKDVVSLIPKIPKNINLFDQWSHTHSIPILYKINRKIRFLLHGDLQYPAKAIRYVKNKKYDWAFHIGEWYSPEFVARYVMAEQKAAWIHSDLSKAEYFDADNYFKYFEDFEDYIFVSKKSMESSVEKYTFLREKACVIYNINQVEEIRSQSKQNVTDYDFSSEIPTIVTCANIRPEKNYCRQVEAMHLLKTRGIDFKWLSIGAQADSAELNKVRALIHQYHLENDFILLGTKENPYKYMKHATAIAVLSDYESWSMVITEAKILGIPVIATKTSGAMEQIEHNETGILCEFSAEDIAIKMERLLYDYELQNKIFSNLAEFNPNVEALNSFHQLIDSDLSY